MFKKSIIKKNLNKNNVIDDINSSCIFYIKYKEYEQDTEFNFHHYVVNKIHDDLNLNLCDVDCFSSEILVTSGEAKRFKITCKCKKCQANLYRSIKNIIIDSNIIGGIESLVTSNKFKNFKVKSGRYAIIHYLK